MNYCASSTLTLQLAEVEQILIMLYTVVFVTHRTCVSRGGSSSKLNGGLEKICLAQTCTHVCATDKAGYIHISQNTKQSPTVTLSDKRRGTRKLAKLGKMFGSSMTGL